MIITPVDIAHLSDNDVRRIVIAVTDTIDAGGAAEQLQDFWRTFTVALVTAFRERRGALAWAEFELDNEHTSGSIVQPGDDPVAGALDELRRAARGEADPLRRFVDGDGQ